MNSSLASGGWDAVGLNAAHCAISAADALLVHKAGIRSAGASHDDTVKLLDQYLEGDGKAAVFKKILSYKNLAAYEAREMIPTEAHDVAKITQRFFDWAQSRLA